MALGVGAIKAALNKEREVTRIVEHPGAPPLGPAVEVHVRYDPEREFPVYVNVEVAPTDSP